MDWIHLSFFFFVGQLIKKQIGNTKGEENGAKCDKGPQLESTVGVLVAGYTSWSLGHKTSQIMSCKHTPFLSLWPCWGVFHAVQHESRNQDLDICCEKHKSERLPAGDVHVFLPWVWSYSISVDSALIKNSSAPGMTSPDTEKQAVRPARMKPLPSYSVMPVRVMQVVWQQMDQADWMSDNAMLVSAVWRFGVPAI